MMSLKALSQIAVMETRGPYYVGPIGNMTRAITLCRGNNWVKLANLFSIRLSSMIIDPAQKIPANRKKSRI
jgi:hypothetical protein